MRFIEALERVALTNPQALAVEGEGRLSYSELWSSVERQAEGLRDSGVPWVIVQGKRSADFLVRLLGAMKAGKAPLILDSKTPTARVESFLSLLQGQSLPSGVEYLCSTSGSSGIPKVVMVGVGSLLSMACQQKEYFALNSDSRYLWMLSPGFDASLSDIATTLLAGGCLVCAGDWNGVLPIKLAEHKITHLDIPPSVLKLYEPEHFPSTLKAVILGGEPSDPAVLRKWARRYRLVAVYGPTETTVCSSLSIVDEDWDKPYIGRPLDGVEYRVEDSELLIGGRQVALGYLGVGVSEKFFTLDGLRWYRTGDLVTEVGSAHGLCFKGRKDRQVQLRGRRLELEEVEYYARLKAGSAAVAATVCDDRLILYWEGQDRLTETLVRESVERHLPEACWPERYVRVDKIPRNESGKVDYRKVPEPPTPLCQMNSLQRIEKLIQLKRAGSGLSTRSLDEEVQKQLEHAPARSRRRDGSFKSILITGATGRLGKALLPLLSEDLDVWRLSRVASDSRTLRGDLSKPKLGLVEDQWEFVNREVDLVVNLGACLDLDQDFEDLRGVNFEALKTLTELGIPIIQASTLATTLCAEPPSLSQHPEHIFGGYAQTKWAAERYLSELDWPGVSLRYGHLISQPDSRELFCLFIRGLLEFGAYPRADNENWCFDITPTEWAAELTAEFLKTGLPEGRKDVILRRGWALHFQHLIDLLSSHGYQLKPINLESFRAIPALTRSTQAAQLAFSEHPQWSPFLWGRLETTVQDEALETLDSYLSRLDSV